MIFVQSLHYRWAQNNAARFTKYFNLQYDRSRLIENLKRKERLPPKYMQLIEDAWNLLESIYPGRGDIQFVLEPKYKMHRNTYGINSQLEFYLFNRLEITRVYIIIHFPEITISNSSDEQLTIKNLYVRVPIELDYSEEQNIIFSTIQGTRSTMSPAEVFSVYQHSHLQGVDVKYGYDMDFQDFCTGSADINIITAELNSGYDVDILESLLYQIDTLIRWESLEGTPYRYIRNVSSKDYRISDCSDTTTIESSRLFMSNLRSFSSDFSLNLQWRFQDGKYAIVDNEQFEECFRLLLHRLMTDITIFYYKDERGEYYKSSRISDSLFRDSNNWIPFRRNKIRFKVEGEYRPPNGNKYIHPKIKNHVKQLLEQHVNLAKVREAAFNQ